MKPLAVDLCCGLGGWTDGLLAEGWDVLGFDIERHIYGNEKYPAQLVLQDILTLDGRQFRGKVFLITASPPCQKYSYMAMPWTRAKTLVRWYEDADHPERRAELNALFNACIRIGKEAECPTIIENVRGAQKWVGRSRWNFGSFHLWGDVPALMPIDSATKVGGFDYGTAGYKAQAFNGTAEKRVREGDKVGGSWWNERDNRYPPILMMSSKSPARARARASAMIAKIPLPLARHIGRIYSPPSSPKP